VRLMGYQQGREVIVARLLGDGLAQPIAAVDKFWEEPFRWGESPGAGNPVRIADVTLAPPVRPSARVICVGLNYPEHAAEGQWGNPKYPTVFARWTASLTVHNAPVRVPRDEEGLDWEAELLAVVGKTAYRADAREAGEVIYGYAPFNDLTARTLQKLTSQWTLGKNTDGSGPMGAIVTAAELGPIGEGLRIESRVNGEVVQSGSTAQMIFDIPALIEFLSREMTLHPGDLIATGTPSGVGYVRKPPRYLSPGDVVEVEVERVGKVTTPIAAS
jgi:2,4-didehydro-3-deoxy-L-rhamnonate hydrolase